VLLICIGVGWTQTALTADSSTAAQIAHGMLDHNWRMQYMQVQDPIPRRSDAYWSLPDSSESEEPISKKQVPAAVSPSRALDCSPSGPQ